MHGWNVLIALHVAGATFALLAGAVLLATPGKGNRTHRRLGAAWVAAMYWTVASSFGIRVLEPGGFSWIHGLSGWTFVSVTVALWAGATRRRRVQRGFVVGSYLGLIGAGLGAVAVPTRLVPQLLLHRPLLFLAVVAGVAVGALVAVRVSQRPALRGPQPPAPV